jgi:hypothetical protein
MDSLKRHTIVNQLVKSLICLIFAVLSTTSARSQGLLPPVITPPILLPSVLSSGGSVTNGGIAVITTTITTLTTLRGAAWYCNGQLVPASKSALTSSNLLIVSTLTLQNVSAINAGSYTLRATNLTGASVSSAAIVVVADLVNTVVSNTVSFVSSATGMTSNGFKLQLSGPTGSNVVVEASSDLRTWVPISTNTFSSGAVSFTDTAAKNHLFRYYRSHLK